MNGMEVAAHFAFLGEVLSAERYGNGHINTTYLICCTGGRYILQKINRSVFLDVEGLMRNIDLVTNHLRTKTDDPRAALRLIPLRDGRLGWESEKGEYYRAYAFIEDSICMDQPESMADFRQSAVGFGAFQRMLADFPAETLVETIPRFHDTVSRYRALHAAIEQDAAGRAKSAKNEIAFALQRKTEADAMLSMLRAGELPLRVTHNDAKLNNVLLDARTREALCVIDLDTVMPGLAANDFGDSIRFGASTAVEDERDLTRVSLSLTRYRAFRESYLEACGSRLTAREVQTLPLGAKLMTLECGVRFLTDYLAGDTYFRIHRENHNLDRCRTQFKLVADMEDHWAEIE